MKNIFKKENNTKWLFLNTFAMMLWGTQYLWSAKIGDSVPGFTLGFLRYLIAFSLLFLIFHKRILNVKVNRKDLVKIALLGGMANIFGVLSIVFGVRLANTVVISTITNTNPIIIMFLASVLIGELIFWWQKLGIIVAFIGVVLLILNGDSIESIINSNYFWGILIALIAAFGIAIYTIYIKNYVKKYGGVVVTFYTLISGSIPLLLVSLLFENYNFVYNLETIKFFYILLFGVITALTYTLLSASLKHIGASKGAAFKILIPFFTTIYSLIFLDEKLTVWIIFGIIFVVIGMILCQIKNKEEFPVELE